MNAVFSSRQINIAGQYLQTNPAIGYVIIDIETPDRSATVPLKRGLDRVPGAIRTRLVC